MDLTMLIIWVPLVLFSITVHEYSHAKAADIMGDRTARLSGRLTLNPISHIDPIGLLMLIFVRFGWAKPVPINPNNFKDYKNGTILVSLAGPASNFFLAWILAMIFRILISLNLPGSYAFLFQTLYYAIWLNVALGVFNLIPIPPLDGSKILEMFLPPMQQYRYRQLEQYGFFILIIFLVLPTSILLFQTVNFIVGLLI